MADTAAPENAENRPQLRPIEAFPIQQNGQTLVCLRDPQNISPPLAISPATYFILSQFDGRRALIDIQEAFSRRFGEILAGEELAKIVDLLSRHFYLYGPAYFERERKVLEEFCRLPTRSAAHAGSVYRPDPAALTAQIDDYFKSPDGPGEPKLKSNAKTPRAIVAPHIDFHRGGPCYAWSYKGLAEASGADLYVLLGTSHCGGKQPFIATLKDFATPLGVVETDKRLVRELQRRYSGDLFADEVLHRSEHSLEFQVVYLKYIARLRAKRSGAERPFKIVPILVSSFHPMVQSRTLPEKVAGVGDFLQGLRGLLARESRSVCLVAGVDLAHVGVQFGDPEPVTPEFLQWVEAEDRGLIERIAALDAPGFFNEIAKDEDRRRICGFSPLYSLIYLLDGGCGRCVKYSQAVTQETGSAVTFTGMVFE